MMYSSLPTHSENSRLVVALLKRLCQEWNVKEIIVAAGARNTPFVDILSEASSVFRVFSFFEERSAGFFALGRMVDQPSAPVAVITTSGTAVGELLPAVMEAFYSQLPLIVVTADRPRRYRGTGAPQVAEQVGIFSSYVSESVDVSSVEEWKAWKGCLQTKPLHLNVCLEEPLSLSSEEIQSGIQTLQSKSSLPPCFTGLTAFSQSVQGDLPVFGRCPFVIVSGLLRLEEQTRVKAWLQAVQVPTYFEAWSGLREDLDLQACRVALFEGALKRVAQSGYEIDQVLRIGRVPTLRLWRDLEDLPLPVLSFSDLPWPGLAKDSQCLPLSALWKGSPPSFMKPSQAYWKREKNLEKSLMHLLQEEPLSEPGLVYQLSREMLQGSVPNLVLDQPPFLKIPPRIFLGTSLPLREWDLAAVSDQGKPEAVWAARGMNGIDGQVSYFLGYSKEHGNHWAILGDLATLYDLAGFWPQDQLLPASLNLVVIHNGGGQIFSRLFPKRSSFFLNAHQLSFEPWAKLWGLRYQTYRGGSLQAVPLGQAQVIEAQPDPTATDRFWKQYQELLRMG